MQLQTCNEWVDLCEHHKILKTQHLTRLFASNPNRSKEMIVSTNNLTLNYSRNHVTQETLDKLCNLADACSLQQNIDNLLSGQTVNYSHNLPALHTALRHSKVHDKKNNTSVAQDINGCLDKMRSFVASIEKNSGDLVSSDPVTDIVFLGIGGSHLGPEMVVEALKEYDRKLVQIHFLSNIDESEIDDILSELSPQTTLFFIASKSFTTQETMMNADLIKTWLNDEQEASKRMYAITMNVAAAIDFGIDRNNVFPLWDWVGGRFSLWSAIGLPIAIAIGFDEFESMLAGAAELDHHFSTAPLSENMPVILALLGIWYINFFGANTHAIIPYSYRLRSFVDHLTQLDMESNGKSINNNNLRVNYSTGPVIWGGVGCNSQHSFHQFLLQGTQLVPSDFLFVNKKLPKYQSHYKILKESCITQAEILMRGNDKQENSTWHLPGNQPSNTIYLDELTPYSLGSLIALYEHKVFTQGVIWNINSFDQCGVEAGKNEARKVLRENVI